MSTGVGKFANLQICKFANCLRPRLGPEEMERDLRESLLRLQTDYIDLYMLHRDDPRIPVSTVIDYLNQEIGAGRIRAIGASNIEATDGLGQNDDQSASHFG